MKRTNLWVGITLLSLIALAAAGSFFWLPYPVSDTSGGRLEGPGTQHLLGTDRLGHDLLTRMLLGARIELGVGLGASIIAAAIGVSFGLAAALANGYLDDIA